MSFRERARRGRVATTAPPPSPTRPRARITRPAMTLELRPPPFDEPAAEAVAREVDLAEVANPLSTSPTALAGEGACTCVAGACARDVWVFARAAGATEVVAGAAELVNTVWLPCWLTPAVAPCSRASSCDSPVDGAGDAVAGAVLAAWCVTGLVAVAFTAPLVELVTGAGTGADAGADGTGAPVAGAEGAGVGAGGADVGGVVDPEVGGVAGVPNVLFVHAQAMLAPTKTVLRTDIVPSTSNLLRPLMCHLTQCRYGKCVRNLPHGWQDGNSQSRRLIAARVPNLSDCSPHTRARPRSCESPRGRAFWRWWARAEALEERPVDRSLATQRPAGRRPLLMPLYLLTLALACADLDRHTV